MQTYIKDTKEKNWKFIYECLIYFEGKLNFGRKIKIIPTLSNISYSWVFKLCSIRSKLRIFLCTIYDPIFYTIWIPDTFQTSILSKKLGKVDSNSIITLSVMTSGSQASACCYQIWHLWATTGDCERRLLPKSKKSNWGRILIILIYFFNSSRNLTQTLHTRQMPYHWSICSIHEFYSKIKDIFFSSFVSMIKVSFSLKNMYEIQ
jgi:hypothetical protein